MSKLRSPKQSSITKVQIALELYHFALQASKLTL